MNKKISILVVDDHPAICLAVKYVLNSAGYENVIVASDGLDAIKIITNSTIDLLIIDLDLPNIDGLSVIERIKKESPALRLLVLSSMTSDVYLMRCRSAGVNGFMSKDDDIEELPFIVGNLMKGFFYFPMINDGDQYKKTAASSENVLSCLSNRELTVFNHLVKGKKNLEIANEMFLSNKTVSTYKSRIFEKLGVSNIADLISISKSING